MDIKAISLRLFSPLINLLTDLVNIIIWRDQRIVLCGAWMGEKFADNSRYIYQYLSENKTEYGLKRVIWVTRNKKVYDLLLNKGYEVYMMHSPKSYYYHFKAGVYIICNIGFYVSGYNGDTMGHLAGHAVKINAWHGIPIKAGKSTGENVKNEGIKGRVKYAIRNSFLLSLLFSPGHWDCAYFLSTGRECSKRCSLFQGIDINRFINTGYPRNCISGQYTEEEEKILAQIAKYDRCILYAPTFREKGEVPHPINDFEFLNFLDQRNILWIEKLHSASKKEFVCLGEKSNILNLPSEFDINVILKTISLLITDYSSVCFDAVAVNTPVLFYAPDYEHYQNQERGFLCDYRALAKDNLSLTIDDLRSNIDRFFEDPRYHSYTLDRMKEIKEEMFDITEFSQSHIINEIISKTGIWR